MRFVGTDLVGTLVGTTPENGLKMRYFGSFFGKLIPAQKQEKCPRCLIFTHLGHFTKAEREGFEHREFPHKNRVFALLMFLRVIFV